MNVFAYPFALANGGQATRSPRQTGETGPIHHAKRSDAA